MRNAFVRAVTKLARREPRIHVLAADTGLISFDRFREELPNQFTNVGIAEANMVSMAAGMAMEGLLPYCFGLSPFNTFRCLEQIRIDGCYQHLPLRIIGVGGGFVYGPHGPTHQAVEDLGVLRPLPGITLLAPADPLETEEATEACVDLPGPVYLRLGRNRDPEVFHPGDGTPPFELGRLRVLSRGSDLLLVSQGVILPAAVEAKKVLENAGFSCTLANCSSLKPFDREGLLELSSKVRVILSVEEHTILGGLGSACAEVLASAAVGKPFRALGVEDRFPERYGTHEQLQAELGLDATGIATAARTLLDRARGLR